MIDSLNAIWGVPDTLCPPGELILETSLVDVYYEIDAAIVAQWGSEITEGTLRWYGANLTIPTGVAVDALIRLLGFWAGQRVIDDGTVTMAHLITTLMARATVDGVCRIPVREHLARVYDEVSALPPMVAARPFRLPRTYYSIVPGCVGDLDLMDWLHVTWHNMGECLVSACESVVTHDGMPTARAAVAHLGRVLRLFATVRQWGDEGTIVWSWQSFGDPRRLEDLLALQALARHPRHRLRDIYTDSPQGILWELRGFLEVMDAGPVVTLVTQADRVLGPILGALYSTVRASTVGIIHQGPEGLTAYDAEMVPHRLSGEMGHVVITAENLPRFAQHLHHGSVMLTRMILADGRFAAIARREADIATLRRGMALAQEIYARTAEEQKLLTMHGPPRATADLLRNSFEANRVGRLLRRMEVLGHDQSRDEYRPWILAACDLAYLLLRYWIRLTFRMAHRREVTAELAWYPVRTARVEEEDEPETEPGASE
jgi:hypothetical protein